jgi:hypothetical protein
MKFGSMKKKLVVGVAAFGLVSGAGVAFAASDAGTQLQNWYNGQFDSATQQSASDFAGYATNEGKKVIVEGNTMLNATKGDIRTAATNEVTRANGAINTALGEHKNALDTQGNSIEAGMQGQFNTFVNNSITATNATIGVAAGQARNYVEGQINSQGTASKQKVTDEVGANRTAAVAELEQKIKDTKKDLQDLLDQKETAATASLKKNLDDRIKELRVLFTQLMDGLEHVKKQAIITEGSAIETLAKSDMDTLVNGIDQ